MNRICRTFVAAASLLTVGTVIAANVPYCEMREYAPLYLAWNPIADFSQVRSIFPHPIMAGRAVVATESGLSLTEDAGLTWKDSPEAAAAKIGAVSDVAFDPLTSGVFYVASATKGVWITKDNGGTFAPIGAKAQGMASDSVASLILYPGDPGRLTLIAVHGKSAPGISITRNGGQTWEVMDADYNFSRVMAGGENSQQLFLFGSTVKDPDVQSCYTSNTAGEYPVEAVHDVVPTDMASLPAREKGGDVVYVATSDSGLYRVSNDDMVTVSHTVKQLPVANVNGWASVAVVWARMPM